MGGCESYCVVQRLRCVVVWSLDSGVSSVGLTSTFGRIVCGRRWRVQEAGLRTTRHFATQPHKVLFRIIKLEYNMVLVMCALASLFPVIPLSLQVAEREACDVSEAFWTDIEDDSSPSIRSRPPRLKLTRRCSLSGTTCASP